MKKRIGLLLCALVLCGCAGQDSGLSRALELRARLNAAACEFTAVITADFDSYTQCFTLACTVQADGTVDFEVEAPAEIAGITGQVSASGGKLLFDDIALAFPLLADGRLSPVAAPWAMLRSLRSGYLNYTTVEGGCLCIAVDDTYESDALHIDVWLDAADLPQRSEILWQGRKILTITLENFAFL
ncbi:MAG: hypothetical protein LUH51_01110 [Firmicutes bacterium]|nr:hypothetical protein [Bacillota bacterium]